jgi:hypothetical protein
MTVQEVSHEVGDLAPMGLQGEVAGVEKMHLRLRQVAAERPPLPPAGRRDR